jgi:hypothetical protein
MATTRFEVDERTDALIMRLRETFGVTTDAAVIRKALALANIAGEHADVNHIITIGPTDDGKPAVKVLLASLGS